MKAPRLMGRLAATLLAGSALAGLTPGVLAQPAAPAAAAPAASAAPKGMPSKQCLDVLERLAKVIPREETGPALRARGLRLSRPLLFPQDAITNHQVDSAARVRMLIDSKGKVVPDSVEVQESVGDPKFAMVMPTSAEMTVAFDLSAAADKPAQFAFTTVSVSCARP